MSASEYYAVQSTHTLPGSGGQLDLDPPETSRLLRTQKGYYEHHNPYAAYCQPGSTSDPLATTYRLSSYSTHPYGMHPTSREGGHQSLGEDRGVPSEARYTTLPINAAAAALAQASSARAQFAAGETLDAKVAAVPLNPPALNPPEGTIQATSSNGVESTQHCTFNASKDSGTSSSSSTPNDNNTIGSAPQQSSDTKKKWLEDHLDNLLYIVCFGMLAAIAVGLVLVLFAGTVALVMVPITMLLGAFGKLSGFKTIVLIVLTFFGLKRGVRLGQDS